MFRYLVKILRSYGHECVMVTGREDTPGFCEAPRALAGDIMPIVFAGGTWKRDAALAEGYSVDIWIDDLPTYIMPPQTLQETLRDLKKYNHPAIKKDGCTC